MIIKVNGFTLPSPHDFEVGTFRLTKSARLASGLMTMDFIAQKVRIDLSWKSISGTDMAAIMAILDADVFYTVEYPDDAGNIQKTFTGYVGDIKRKMHRSDGKRVWKDVVIPFIQQ